MIHISRFQNIREMQLTKRCHFTLIRMVMKFFLKNASEDMDQIIFIHSE